MSYDAKTDWKYNDPVTEDDFNRIEQGIKDAHEMVENQTNDLTAHKNNDTRHITQQERNKWNNKVSQDDFDEAVNDITSQLTQLANEFNESKTLVVASSANQNINNNVVTPILFDNITTYSFDNIATNDFAILENGQIKIIKKGIYQIVLTAFFDSNGDGARYLIPHNTNYTVVQNAVIGSPTRMQATAIFYIVDSEFILHLRVMQNSGSSLLLHQAYCQLRKIG